MPADLRALVEAVEDEATFLVFLAALRADWHEEHALEEHAPSSPHGPGALGWENLSVGDFLESAEAWARASASGMLFYTPPQNPWRRVAHILLAGKFYE